MFGKASAQFITKNLTVKLVLRIYYMGEFLLKREKH